LPAGRLLALANAVSAEIWRARRIAEEAAMTDWGPNVPVPVKTLESEGLDGPARWSIDGELTPALTVDVSKLGVYFEHHTLLWKHAQARVEMKPMAGAWRRMWAGMPIFMGIIRGDGEACFSRGSPGQLVTLHLRAGQSILAREHVFLAAQESVEYDFERQRGAVNWIAGDTGFFVDRFTGNGAGGALWLHARGNVFQKRLGPGERIDLAPGAWLCRDRSVSMETRIDSLASGLLARGGNLIVNRFTGPGLLLFQSGREEPSAAPAAQAPTPWWAALAALLGSR
jgi:uncharacterized protein (AIM24 family)